MEKITRRALLFDFYGMLLTKKQTTIYDLYYQQDLSLGEIAEIQGVSRTAIFDLLKRTDQSLEEYEKKLGLLEKYLIEEELCSYINKIMPQIEGSCSTEDVTKINELIKMLQDR